MKRLALCILLAACVPVPPGPPDFQRGFEEGNDSAQRACGNIYLSYKKDLELYRTNSDYRTGWDDGFQAGPCLH